MATATVKPARTLPLPRWSLGVLALVAVVVAEILVAIPSTNPTIFPYQQYGLLLHILLAFALLFVAVYIQDWDMPLSLFLVALSLAPLIRIFSLSMPRFWGTSAVDTLPWLAVVGIPLMTAAGAVAYVQRISLRDLGLRLLTGRGAGIQIAIAATGVPLGFIEYTILREQAWIPSPTLEAVVLGGLVMFFATGLAEEIIFRGIMLRRAIEILGTNWGVLFVTCVFSAMHIFFRNLVDLAFVFCVGLLYAAFMVKTKNLWGAIGSHTLANVILYLIAPFLLVHILPPLGP